MKYLLMTLLLLPVASCDVRRNAASARPAHISVIDDNGHTIELEVAATRVISLVPAATKIIEALQTRNVLIGRTQEERETTDDAVDVGTVLEPSVERIIALNPDLVIAWADADIVLSRLLKTGIPTYAARFDRMAATSSHIRRLGTLMGQRSRADSIAAAITNQLEASRARYRTSEHPTVLYVIEIDPLWTVGARTFIDDMIQAAGGSNVFHDLPRPWNQITMEAIVARQPDVVILANVDAHSWQNTKTKAGWRDLRAVRSGRVYAVDGRRFHSPGPGLVDSVRELARLIHQGAH